MAASFLVMAIGICALLAAAFVGWPWALLLLTISVFTFLLFAIRKAGPSKWLRLGALLILTAAGVRIYRTLTRPVIGFYTEIESVVYRGRAAYDRGRGQWIITHTLLLDSAQAAREFSYIAEDRREARAAVRAVLSKEGWQQVGVENGRLMFRREANTGLRVPWYRPAMTRSVVIPTLGRRFEGVMMLLPSESSYLTLVAPPGVVLETYPGFGGRTVVLSNGALLEELRIPVPAVEDQPTVVGVRLSGPLFRNRVTSVLLNRSIAGWLWIALLTVAVGLSVELQRRLGKPAMRALLDKLGVPDYSKEH